MSMFYGFNRTSIEMKRNDRGRRRRFEKIKPRATNGISSAFFKKRPTARGDWYASMTYAF